MVFISFVRELLESDCILLTKISGKKCEKILVFWMETK
jgi:hypothetical protein